MTKHWRRLSPFRPDPRARIDLWPRLRFKCYLYPVNRGWRKGAAGVAGAVIAAFLGGLGAAEADELVFAVANGRVTLTATEVPLGDVLAEWSRAGSTRFEGVGELGAAPVTLHLEGVPERDALRLLLRPAAGFLAAPRRPGDPGASIYDLVRIRVARRAPPPAPAGASAARRRPPPPRPVRESPGLSVADQRERLQRLLRPASGVEAGGGAGCGSAPRRRGVCADHASSGMVVEPEPPAPR